MISFALNVIRGDDGESYDLQTGEVIDA